MLKKRKERKSKKKARKYFFWVEKFFETSVCYLNIFYLYQKTLKKIIIISNIILYFHLTLNISRNLC